MADFVAGAVGFTITWNPNAGQPGSIASLTGLTCTMIVTSAAYRGTFVMTVAANGLTASYTTQAVGDFPAAGTYQIAFQAMNPGGGLALETPPVTRVIAAAL